MKCLYLAILTVFVTLSPCHLVSLAAPHRATLSPPQTSLWYRQPDEKWIEALPIGNGRLGAMVFGRVNDERIQLNEETLWEQAHSGDTHNPDARKYLPEVRRLLFEGKNEEATQLANQRLMGIPQRMKSYQTLGDLSLDPKHTARPEEY